MATAQELLDDLQARGIRRVKVGGFDIDGVLRGKYMSLDKLESALAGGFGFCDVIFGWDIADTLYDSSSVTGWERGFPDAQAVLDPDTLRAIPWEPGVAALLVDFRDERGEAHPACPRALLRRVRDRARAMGFEALFSCEYEFFLFKETPESLHHKRFSGLTSLSPGMFGYSWVRSGQQRELVAAILDGLEAFDVPIEGFHTETGPGVFEAALVYDEVVRAADKAALFKVAMKQVAREHGLSVTFMAKWNAALPGSSGHLHQSLTRDGKNAFFEGSAPGPSVEPTGRGRMSSTMRHYLGGLVALMPELTAIISPTVNSYKRYVPGVWAPLTASWGIENRTAAARVIGLDSPKAARVEFRQTAADLNPYLAMAACLAAGLHGIEHAIEPPAEASGDAGGSGAALPRNLGEALARFEQSKVAVELFGEPFVRHYAHTRRWELRQYERAVTDWELSRYFEAV
jgi:glutamine synthetase